MYFEIIGEITDIEIIAKGRGIRELARLRKKYGPAIGVNSKVELPSEWRTAAFIARKSIGTKHTVSAESDSRLSGLWIEPMKKTSSIRFAICLKNKGSEDLIVRKVYKV